MTRKFLKAKIHRATVTGANVDYEGSVSIDPGLLDQAGIDTFESVQIYNISNGERLETYAIAGNPGEICLNGAAAWKAKEGDKVIICSFAWLNELEAQHHQPRILLLDGELHR